MQKIEAKDFENAFSRIMHEVQQDVEETIRNEEEKLIEVGYANVVRLSPVRRTKRPKKDRLKPYRNSWKTSKITLRGNSISGRIYLGTKKYKISHLLELGHKRKKWETCCCHSTYKKNRKQFERIVKKKCRKKTK